MPFGNDCELGTAVPTLVLTLKERNTTVQGKTHTNPKAKCVCEGESQTVYSVNRRRYITQPDPLVHRITGTVGFHSQVTQTSICYKCLCARDHNRKYKHGHEKNDDKFIK